MFPGEACSTCRPAVAMMASMTQAELTFRCAQLGADGCQCHLSSMLQTARAAMHMEVDVSTGACGCHVAPGLIQWDAPHAFEGKRSVVAASCCACG
mmetsp:Transcript_63648/g.149482  ORF Transcript_63648/g.149482 Transcript_63648/m.149482 type:complete len:96 (-) Transcript_63648:302-589(-)